MNEVLLDLLGPDRWPVFALVSTRVTALIMTSPVWSMRVLPISSRMALGVVLTAVLMPRVATVQLPPDVLALPAALAGEFMIGALIGLTITLFIHGASLGGEIIGVQSGLSIGGSLNPAFDGGPNALGDMMIFLILAMYITIGGHLHLIAGIAGSLEFIPPGTTINFERATAGFASSVSMVFVAAVRIAAPVMVALLMANVALAIMNRAVPQLQTLMIAFPITIGLALVVFGASLPFFGGLVTGWVDGTLESAEVVTRTLVVR